MKTLTDRTDREALTDRSMAACGAVPSMEDARRAANSISQAETMSRLRHLLKEMQVEVDQYHFALTQLWISMEQIKHTSAQAATLVQRAKHKSRMASRLLGKAKGQTAGHD